MLPHLKTAMMMMTCGSECRYNSRQSLSFTQKIQNNA
jgi:hypothetical protein